MITRVLMVTPGFRGRPGGVEVHCWSWSSGLAPYGLDVEVITAARGIRRRTNESHGDCSSTVYPAWRTQAMSIAPRVVLGAARRQLGSRHRARAQLSRHDRDRGAADPASCRVHPALSRAAGPFGGGRPVAQGLSVSRRRVLRRADAVICVSRAERDLLVSDFPFVADKVEVIPNGAHIADLRHAEPFSDTIPTVLCVGQPGTVQALRRRHPVFHRCRAAGPARHHRRWQPVARTSFPGNRTRPRRPRAAVRPRRHRHPAAVVSHRRCARLDVRA